MLFHWSEAIWSGLEKTFAVGNLEVESHDRQKDLSMQSGLLFREQSIRLECPAGAQCPTQQEWDSKPTPIVFAFWMALGDKVFLLCWI